MLQNFFQLLQRISIPKRYQNLLFGGLLLVVAGLNYYYTTSFYRPGYMHRWRQADCASISFNYYQNGMHFFEPEVHGFVSDGFTSGKAATSEVPTLYYTVAALYKVFGFHEFIYRLLTGLLCLLGLFYLFKTLHLLTKDFFWSALGSLFFFTSPVLAYYGNNYISNAPAFFIVLIAWFSLIKYIRQQHVSNLLVALTLFLIAGTFKVTALLSFFAVTGVFFLEWLGILHIGRKNEPVFRHKYLMILGTLVILAIVGGWIVFAKNYNQANDTLHFSTRTFPIWKMTPEQRASVWDRVSNSWAKHYFHITFRYTLVVMLVFIGVFYRYSSRFLNWVLVFLFIGTATYISLQFDTFRDHDYYTINLFIVPVLVVMNFLITFNKRFPCNFKSLYVKGAFLALLFVNIVHAHNEVHNRYWGLPGYFHYYTGLHDIEPYLDSIGISPKHTVLSINDEGQSSLYLINRSGVPNYCNWMRNEEDIQRFVDAGIDYLMVIGSDRLYNPLLKNFIHHKAGQWKDVYFYHLQADLDSQAISYDTVFLQTSFEEEASWLRSTSKEPVLQGTLSKEVLRSGIHSLKMEGGYQIGLVHTLSNIPKGSLIELEAFVYPSDKWCRFVYDGGVPDIRYERSFKEEISGADWSRLHSNLLIPETISDGDSVRIEVVNVEPDSVFIDDYLVRILMPAGSIPIQSHGK